MFTDRLEAFLASFDDDDVASDIHDHHGLERSEARAQFVKYKNETRFALRVIAPHIATGKRILEVGSGPGILSYFLRSEGYDITALEPVGIGYDFMGAAFDAMSRRSQEVDLPFLPIGAEALDPAIHGQFDLVFSIHVLEHLPDREAGLNAMDRVLADGGTMLHVCPNYRFPYDPHFGIPLIPVWPAATRYILPSSIGSSGKWKSINFITAGHVERFARNRNYTIRYSANVFADMIKRTQTDAEFSKRHSGFAGRMIKLARATGLLGLVEKVPPQFLSPIIFTMQRGSPRTSPSGYVGSSESGN
ncbi:MAG: methyltransferase domain-containing protein [Pseudaminobacter sp.]|nr:methyltransferase domain-containing protein [Pseudaminobacter sp.]